MSNKKPRLSLRKAINDKCKDCIYDKLAEQGTWRQQTEACTVYSCPLYPVRPVSANNSEKEPLRHQNGGENAK